MIILRLRRFQKNGCHRAVLNAVRESELTLQNYKVTLSPHREALFRNIITFG